MPKSNRRAALEIWLARAEELLSSQQESYGQHDRAPEREVEHGAAA